MLSRPPACADFSDQNMLSITSLFIVLQRNFFFVWAFLRKKERFGVKSDSIEKKYTMEYINKQLLSLLSREQAKWSHLREINSIDKHPLIDHNNFQSLVFCFLLKFREEKREKKSLHTAEEKSYQERFNLDNT